MPRPSQNFVRFIALCLTIISSSFAAAQTPASSETEQTDATVEQSAAPAQSPVPSPHHTTKAVSATTHAKMKPAPAATPVHAGFGSMMPGVHTQTSPAPARTLKSKKTVAEKAGSPAPKKIASAAAPIKQPAPAGGTNVVSATQSTATTHATPPPVRETAPLGDQAAVRTSQPTVTTGEIVVPAAPAPPAEGPVNVPAKQRAPVTIATPPPADQPPPPVVTATAPPAVGPAPVQQTASKTAANLNAQVWVNMESHVYHRQGARYYGKTRKGKYMTEQEAIAEGNRPAREWTPPSGKGGQ